MANGTLINQSLDWKLAGTGGSCTIPANCHEMLVFNTYTNANGTWSYTIPLPKPVLDIGGRFFSGYYASSGNNFVQVAVGNGSVAHQVTWVDGANVTTFTSTYYYWR